MIERCKEILAYKDSEGRPIIDPDTGETMTYFDLHLDYNTRKEFTLNTVEFRAHPADNIDSIRSQPNMRMILIDEIAFFRLVEQQKVRDAFEHYIGASEVLIILITTAGFSPSGVAYDIETEDPSIYRKHLYDYNIGLVVHPESMTSLYIKSEIDELRGSVSFNRNHLGIWGYGAGNIYDSRTLDEITKLSYELKDIRSLPNILSIDPAYGKVRDRLSSKFAGLGMYKENGETWTRSYFELDEPSDEEALARIRKEIKDYGYKTLVCDGHWTGIINTFSKEINSYGIVYTDHLNDMTDTAQLEVTNLRVHIHPTHEPLTVQLRSIKRDERGVPAKKLSRFDLGDCFQQGIWHFTGGQVTIRKLKSKF
jgi:phage terminase large subunit-like protein